MMKPRLSLFFALACLALSATLASAQGGEAVRDEINLRGRVEAVDHVARTVRIRGDQGNVVTLDVPQSATRFEEVKVGDLITVAYSDRVSVRLKPADEPPVDRTVARTTTTGPTDLPGATRSNQRVQTVTITSWDPATGMITFTGPSGATYERHLIETTAANVMAGIKVGDRVDVTRTEAASLSVQPGAPMPTASAAPAAVVETLLNRLTISALWGLDNQFSGKLIKETTGQTVGGVPINLHETSYDDVYGRMALFKIGVGYRTSPRSEVAFNFVLSRSSSETVQIGTVGPASVPVRVNFDDFNYWGLEVGQRFFFTRTRFTPYVGYLVGANRNGDIRGKFEQAPPGVTLPGYAAQDGKFFEKSWAFSVGPIGGFLVGLGPVEVFAETQWRFMGGLSDVDWLVEEGLKDINSESSRWSLPFLFGVRFRF